MWLQRLPARPMFLLRCLAMAFAGTGVGTAGLVIFTPSTGAVFNSSVTEIGCVGNDTENQGQGVLYSVEVVQQNGKLEVIAGSGAGKTEDDGSWFNEVAVGGLKAGRPSGVRVRNAIGEQEDFNTITIVDP